MRGWEPRRRRRLPVDLSLELLLLRRLPIIDANTASVQLAFAGAVAPNAVPTTLVIDREGRVAARISGLIRDRSILASMIDRVLDEEG